MAPAVELRGAGKRYRKYEDNPLLLTAALRLRRSTRRSTTWAVRGVDLAVEEGECVGVIGRNGSGKSTMLQLLAGVSAPTEGSVIVRGRVAPLLAVGVGFNPELTGRENVYLNATILGASQAEIDAAFDEVVDFAEIGPFIDTPVKFYSSGMTVRLGFAVASQIRPEIVLLDEVLAVGDIAFQMKCFDRMGAIVDSGATVLLVSHNMNAIRRLCDRVLVLHGGTTRFLGATEDAVQHYLDAIHEAPPAEGSAGGDPLASGGIAGVAKIVDVSARVADRRMTVDVEFDAEQPWEKACLAVFVATSTGVPIYHGQSEDLGPMTPGRHVWSADCGSPLATGDYLVTVALRSLDPYARLDRAPTIEVRVDGRSGVDGVVDLRGRLTARPATFGRP